MSKEPEIEIKLKINKLNICDLSTKSTERKRIVQGYMDLNFVSVRQKNIETIKLSVGAVSAEIKVPEDMVSDCSELFGEGGHIKTNLGTSVRIRTTQKQGGEEKFEFTIKTEDQSDAKGKRDPKVRTEFNIPLDDEILVGLLYKIAGQNLVEKIRFVLPSNLPNVFWEVDVYEGANKGLVTAEAEINSVDAERPRPLEDWDYQDVTGMFALTNDSLSRIPFVELQMSGIEYSFF